VAGHTGSLILEMKGLRIGLIGLTTPSTPTVTNPVNVAVAALRRARPGGGGVLAHAPRPRREVIIGVVHAGGKCAKWDDPQDL